MERSVVTDEMKAKAESWQGEAYVGGQAHLEDIRNFATAVGDDNGLWLDTDYARSTRWGGIIAPPTFVDRFTPFYVLGDDNSQGYLGGPMPIKRPFRHGFSASDEHEIFRPVRPGAKAWEEGTGRPAYAGSTYVLYTNAAGQRQLAGTLDVR